MTQKTDKLETLFTRLIDSRDGYREALDHVESPFIKGILNDFFAWRDREVAELRGFLSQKGVDLDDDGSLLAAAHRVFLDVKDRVTGTEDESALAEIVRGEEKLAEDFEAAISECSGTDPEYDFLVKEHDAVTAQIETLKTKRHMAA